MRQSILASCVLGGLALGFAAPATSAPLVPALSSGAETAQTVAYRCWWDDGRRRCRYFGDRDDRRYRDRDWRSDRYERRYGDRDDRRRWWRGRHRDRD